MKVLVDGDIVVFRAAFAAEKAHYLLRYEHGARTIELPFDAAKDLKKFVKANALTEYDTFRERTVEPVENVYANIKGLMGQIEAATNGLSPTVYLTGNNNFRRLITKTYKANRDPTMRPHYEAEAREYLRRKYGAYTVSGIEADDAIGLEMDETAICVSLDKDLDTLPGRHYNWVRNEHYEVSSEEARTNLFAQMLIGDRADNIRGVPGIGQVWAHKLLDGLSAAEQERKVRELYSEHGLDYLMNYHLVHILQNEEDVHAAFEYATNCHIEPPSAPTEE